MAWCGAWGGISKGNIGLGAGGGNASGFLDGNEGEKKEGTAWKEMRDLGGRQKPQPLGAFSEACLQSQAPGGRHGCLRPKHNGGSLFYVSPDWIP